MRFEADVTADETNSGTNNEPVTVSLVDNGSSLIQSEKLITVVYALDTDKSESEVDYTSGSFDSDVNQNKYTDDFIMSDGTLEFSAKTYVYQPATDTYSVINGEETKDITLSIYGDDLYEVDEYVNIEITSVTNSQSAEKMLEIILISTPSKMMM